MALSNFHMIVRLTSLMLIFSSFFSVSCDTHKNEDFVIINNQIASIRNYLKENPNYSTEGIIAHVDLLYPTSRGMWKISENNKYLIRSKNKHSIRATKNKEYYYYIRSDGDLYLTRILIARE